MKSLIASILLIGSLSVSAASNKVIVCASETGSFLRFEFASAGVLRVQLYMNESRDVMSVPAASKLDENDSRLVEMYIVGQRSFMTLPSQLFQPKKIAQAVRLEGFNDGQTMTCRN